MSELAELLELVHGAGKRWGTARLTVRRWGDSDLSGIALRRYAERRQAAGARTAVATAPGGEGPSTWDMVTRAWVDRTGDRLRVETSGAHHGESLHVRVGPRWWSYTPHSGSISNEAEPEMGGGGGDDFSWMLEPASLLPALDFAPSGPAEVAGRPALGAVATPRPEDPRWGFAAYVAHGADDVVLAVDRERGVVLRAEARLGGRPFAVHETTEVAFDEPLTDDLFRFVSPDGSPVRSPRDTFPRPEPLSVEEAARRASFTVLVPTRLPEGWAVDATYSPPSDRPPRPDQVNLHLGEADRTAPRLRIHQSPRPHDDGLEWETVEQRGRRILLWRHSSPGATYEAKLEVQGTHVRASGNIDRDALVHIVASLQPAPRQLPPMVER